MLQTKAKTGLVFFPAFDWAISDTHPEREERLLYTQDQVFEEGLLDIEGIVEYKPDLITVEDIQRVHFCFPDERRVITESHLISAGGAKKIGIEVMEKRIERGFALVRPPGHHAMRVVHGARGFCNINIEAIMIEYLRQHYGVDRVAIVDTDCHHGDGTQDIYWHDPDTLFISVHQDGRTLYPGSGFHNEVGGPTAVGSTVNIPLPPRTSEEGFLFVLDELILPILAEFKPDLIVNSAGQDNHYTDPITNMCFSAQGYAELTQPPEARHRGSGGGIFHRRRAPLRQCGNHHGPGGHGLQQGEGTRLPAGQDSPVCGHDPLHRKIDGGSHGKLEKERRAAGKTSCQREICQTGAKHLLRYGSDSRESARESAGLSGLQRGSGYRFRYGQRKADLCGAHPEEGLQSLSATGL